MSPTPRMSAPAIVIDGETFPIPVERKDWKLGELADLREIAGVDLDKADEDDPRVLLALTFIAVRRRKPGTTLDQIRNLSMELVAAQAPEPLADDPTEELDDPAGSSSGSEGNAAGDSGTP